MCLAGAIVYLLAWVISEHRGPFCIHCSRETLALCLCLRPYDSCLFSLSGPIYSNRFLTNLMNELFSESRRLIEKQEWWLTLTTPISLINNSDSIMMLLPSPPALLTAQRSCDGSSSPEGGAWGPILVLQIEQPLVGGHPDSLWHLN